MPENWSAWLAPFTIQPASTKLALAGVGRGRQRGD